MTREQTAKLLAMAKAMWPDHPTPDPEAMTTAYWMGLEDVSADAAAHAFKTHLKDPQRGRFFPKVADLRAALPPMPMVPQLPSGERREAADRFIFRIYDADLDDYVELPEPVPFGDPRCPSLIEQDRAAIRLAGERKRENAVREQAA